MEKELKILMLEDQEEDAGLIERALKKENFKFTHVRIDTREKFTESLLTFKPDVILSDHSLPQFNSIEAYKIYKDMGVRVPFILVTGAVSEEFAVECIKRGVDDYVLKSNLSRLPIAIRTALEHYQEEQTLQKQGERLLQQNEELIKINQELDSFVYSVSHNLRSPLSSILGLINVARMEEGQSTEILDRYFELIKRSVLKLDETIREILDYSRNARNEVVPDNVNLEPLIQDAFEQLKYMSGYNEIKKEIKIVNECQLYSDTYRIKVIMANLISNAVKYCDLSKDSPCIRVTAVVSAGKALIEIYDNGIGIHENLLPHVYKMFYRATEKGEGSGLGLYIVKEMVNKLKGEITITSTLGMETNIMLSIPNTMAPEHGSD